VTTFNLAAVIELFVRIQRAPQSKCFALLDPPLAAAEYVLREAGAIEVVQSALAASAAARIVRRHLDQTPAEPEDTRAAAFVRLPWPNHATIESPTPAR